MANVTGIHRYYDGAIIDIQSYISNILKDEIKFDDNVDSWLFINTPWYIVTTIAVYLLFVLKIGPNFMKNRRPMNIKFVMLIYNAMQTLFNGWLVCWLIFMPGTFNYIWNYSCCSDSGPEYKDHTRNQLYTAMWYYFVSKVADLLDTVFFVLRKKQSQLTFLHLYHHVNMAFSAWVHLRYIKNEQIVIGGVINTIIHTVMYSYYFLSALGPQVRKHLWWKKYLTRLQILQFVLVMVYVFGLFVFECKFPKLFMIYVILDLVLFLYMFLTFYRKTYTKTIKIR